MNQKWIITTILSLLQWQVYNIIKTHQDVAFALANMVALSKCIKFRAEQAMLLKQINILFAEATRSLLLLSNEQATAAYINKRKHLDIGHVTSLWPKVLSQSTTASVEQVLTSYNKNENRHIPPQCTGMKVYKLMWKCLK